MTDWPPLRDYRRSFAVLMGTWDYEFMDRVPAAQHSLRRMERLLTGPLCGWPQERMLVLPNVASLGDLPDRLITAFDGITDAALFYFVGHGQISPEDELCMGLTQSRTESHRRAATSLRFSDVRQALRNGAAAAKIVILDCCFAGLATQAASLAGDVLDLTAGTGAYTMAATSAYTTAWYQDDPGLALPQTYFTKYLADLIEHGIPGQPIRLRLDPLFRQLRDNLAADGRPIPRNRAVNDAREFVFAYNAAPPHTHHDPERDLAQLREAAGAEISMLRAEAAERERELARLKTMMATSAQRDIGQQRELQDAIDTATRQLDDNQAAQTAAALLGDSLADPQPAKAQPENQTPGPGSSRSRTSAQATQQAEHQAASDAGTQQSHAEAPSRKGPAPGGRHMVFAGALAVVSAVLAFASLFPTYMAGVSYAPAPVQYSLSAMTPWWSPFIISTAALYLTAGACVLIRRWRSSPGDGLLLAAAAAATGALAYNLSHLVPAFVGDFFDTSSHRSYGGGYWLQIASNLTLILAVYFAVSSLVRASEVRLVCQLPRNALPRIVALLGIAGALALVFQDLGSTDNYTAPAEVSFIVMTVWALVMPAWAAVVTPRRLGAALLAGWIWVGAAFCVYSYLFLDSAAPGSVLGNSLIRTRVPTITFGVTLLALAAMAIPFARTEDRSEPVT